MNMVHRVQELALGYPEGRLELQLIGGYSDSRNYSEELFYNIMRKSLFSLCKCYIHVPYIVWFRCTNFFTHHISILNLYEVLKF
jgi:hypothetical protein